jgi:hypothetical protein
LKFKTLILLHIQFMKYQSLMIFEIGFHLMCVNREKMRTLVQKSSSEVKKFIFPKIENGAFLDIPIFRKFENE